MDRDLVAAAVAGHLGRPAEVTGSGERFEVASERGALVARLVEQGHGWMCGKGWRLVLLGSTAHDGPGPDWLALHNDGRWWSLGSEKDFRSFVAAVFGDLSEAALAGILAANHAPMGASRLIVDADDLKRTAAELADSVAGPIAPARTSQDGRWQLTFLSAALHPDAEGLDRLWVWRWQVTGASGGTDLAWWALPVVEGELLDRYRP